jgi:hypothetical protein
MCLLPIQAGRSGQPSKLDITRFQYPPGQHAPHLVQRCHSRIVVHNHSKQYKIAPAAAKASCVSIIPTCLRVGQACSHLPIAQGDSCFLVQTPWNLHKRISIIPRVMQLACNMERRSGKLHRTPLAWLTSVEAARVALPACFPETGELSWLFQ